jgi:hypothetical protein
MTAGDWAAQVIGRGHKLGEIPRYGSAEWERLPQADARRVVAVVQAAEAWRLHTDPETVRRDLELEITANAQLERAQEAAAFRELAARVRRLSKVPTQREIEQRRAAVTP